MARSLLPSPRSIRRTLGARLVGSSSNNNNSNSSSNSSSSSSSTPKREQQPQSRRQRQQQQQTATHASSRTATETPASVPTPYHRILTSPQERILHILESNPHYLLHACVRSNWKHVRQVCTLYATYYQNVCRNSNADANGSSTTPKTVRSHIQRQLHHIDPWGNTALHVALHEKPTVAVVRALLDLLMLGNSHTCCDDDDNDNDNPSGPAALVAAASAKKRATPEARPSLLLMCNSRGQTPLHVACANGCSTNVLQVLVDSNSYTDAATHAMFLPDQSGYTVFDVLLHYYEMWLHVPIVQKYNPKLRDFNKKTILDKVEEEQRRELEQEGYATRDEDEDDVSTLCIKLWRSVDLLLQAAWWSSALHRDTYHEDSSSLRSSLPGLLHAAAYCSTILPARLTDALFRVYHGNDTTRRHHCDDEDKHIATNDDNRNPLHVLVSTPLPSITPRPQHAVLLRNRRHFVRQCVEYYGETTTTTARRTFFHQAIASGFLWNEDYGGDDNDDEDDHSSSSRRNNGSNPDAAPFLVHGTSALTVLWKEVSASATFSEFDPQTGMYPFQLAALASADGDVDDHNNEDDCRCDANTLDTIYQLLRIHPQVLEESL